MITFTSSMETGIPVLDAQHRELFNRINAVLTAGSMAVTKEETEKTLTFLSDYVVRHFKDEEKLQNESHYPEAAAHQSLHKSYIENLRQLQKEFEQNGPSAKFTLTLNQSIIDWLVKHIGNADKSFAQHYKRVKA